MLQTMAEDVVALWHALVGLADSGQPAGEDSQAGSSGTASSSSLSQATVIVGHSMGGAIAVWAAATGRIPGLAGCCLVDIVEGTALGEWVGRTGPPCL